MSLGKKGHTTPPVQGDLNLTNPELFRASPRPGGFLKILVPTRSQEFIASEPPDDDECCCKSDADFCMRNNNATLGLSSRSQLNDTYLPHLNHSGPSREFRLTRAIQETDWSIRGIDETDTLIELSNPLQDALNLLAVTVTCVMLMASQAKCIGDEYFDWAEQYLECIVDDEDGHPPNIQGLLNHILFLRKGGQVTSGAESPTGSARITRKHAGGGSGTASPTNTSRKSEQPGTPGSGSRPSSRRGSDSNVTTTLTASKGKKRDGVE